MSVFFDILWWWRAEFGGKPNPYIEPGNTDQPPTLPRENFEPSVLVTEARGFNSPSDPTLNHPETLMDMLANASEIPDWNLGGFGDSSWDSF
jgi:hypothetical protein